MTAENKMIDKSRSPTTEIKKIVIVGGGFAGIRCALNLEKKLKKANLLSTHKIILISDKTHFEYHAALYRVVTGRSPLEVCIPLSQIFDGKEVEIIKDKVTKVDLRRHELIGESECFYTYDYLILALGSQTDYFDISGLTKYSFGFKSIQDALRLKRHIHESFSKCESLLDKVCASHIMVVGAGASGVELAGELAIYTKTLAKMHKIDPSLITIDLVEMAPRVLPQMPIKISEIVERRLRMLGVNILLNRMVVKREIQFVFLQDMEIRAKTLIWTAGVRANKLYGQISGLRITKKGQVEVDEKLRALGFENVFVLGDGAATELSGMATTALQGADFVAGFIVDALRNNDISRNKGLSKKLPKISKKAFLPKKPVFAIPVGPGWAVAVFDKFSFFGFLGWLVRRWFDLSFFMTILPFTKALTVFQHAKALCETCEICESDKINI